jgi:hypothetical protein
LEIDVAAAWCWGSHGFDVDFPRDGARAVVFGVLAEVVGQIGPAATDADHDTLALADEADEQLDRFFTPGLRQVIQLDLGITGVGGFLAQRRVGRSQSETSRRSGRA